MATLSGWIAACVTLQLISLCGHDWKPHDLTPFIGIGILIAVMSSAVFVPLYLNVPRNNFFWNSANAIWVTDKQSSIPIQAIIWIDFPRNGFFVIYVIFAVNHNF